MESEKKTIKWPTSVTLSELTGQVVPSDTFVENSSFHLCQIKNLEFLNIRGIKASFRNCFMNNIQFTDSYLHEIAFEGTNLYNVFIPKNGANEQVKAISCRNCVITDSNFIISKMLMNRCEIFGISLTSEKIEANYSYFGVCFLDAPVMRFENCVLNCIVKTKKLILSRCTGGLYTIGNPEIIFPPEHDELKLMKEKEEK